MTAISTEFRICFNSASLPRNEMYETSCTRPELTKWANKAKCDLIVNFFIFFMKNLFNNNNNKCTDEEMNMRRYTI